MPKLYDSHTHTSLCKHATGTLDEYVEVASQQGLAGIIFTCHNPAPFGWAPHVRMSIHQLGAYIDLVQQTRETWAGKIDVRLGLESDYVPGMEAWLTELHASAPFDYILGSIHPYLPEYHSMYFDNDIAAFQRAYFEHLACAAETGLFDALSHPDVIKIVFPDIWDPLKMLDDIKRCLDRIARTGTALEVNTSGLHKPIRELMPGPLMLEEMHKRDIPVVLGSDAHQPSHVGRDFQNALHALADAGYTHIRVFKAHRPEDIAISTQKLVV